MAASPPLWLIFASFDWTSKNHSILRSIEIGRRRRLIVMSKLTLVNITINLTCGKDGRRLRSGAGHDVSIGQAVRTVPSTMLPAACGPLPALALFSISGTADPAKSRTKICNSGMLVLTFHVTSVLLIVISIKVVTLRMIAHLLG
jgi:hypothetical protein